MKNQEEFLKKIRGTFKIEAEEAIQKISSNLIELEKHPAESRKFELIEVTFREAHSLKGAARAVNISEIETICQALENVFSALKNEKIKLVHEVFDIFHFAVNIISEILLLQDGTVNDQLDEQVSLTISNLWRIENDKLDEIVEFKSDPEPVTSNVKTKNEEVIAGQSSKEQKNLPTDIPADRKKISDKTIRVSIEKLDELLFQVEELLTVKLQSFQRTKNLRAILRKLNDWKKASSDVYPAMRNLKQKLERKQKEGNLTKEDERVNILLQYFEKENSFLKTVESGLSEMQNISVQESFDTGLKIETLMQDVKKIITIPFSTVLDVFPKATRDLSKDKSKKVDFIVNGDDIEIDRRILEEIRNPLIHLLRNCIDHGIEKPEVRKSKNKPEKGCIKFNIERLENNKVEITISDDGAGIDLKKLKNEFLRKEKNVIQTDEEIKEQELLNYIFKSGVSTTDIITDISGRGLGLAIVREKIEQLGGLISVKTIKDKGTEFKIQLPLSLVTFKGVIIRAGDMEFVVPTSNVEKMVRIKKTDIKTVENKETISFNGGVIPLVYLTDILEQPFKEKESEFIQAMILGTHENQTGFTIDEILDEHEVLTKKFNKQLTRVRNISGATVLGSGKVIPILNVSDLLKSAVKKSYSFIKEKVDEEEQENKRVLVVEDSITSRMLLKNILETAGYFVETAIDGIEGFTKLKEGDFNVVVSDVDMPRMDGFDLTSKIRSEDTLSEMPVVLVTSLSKKEDREHGMEVGANAYIVKSNFDQSNLLEVIDRFVN